MLKQVLMIAAENDAIPGAKVGGVADVVRDAPLALAKNNINVDVIIPDHNNYHQAFDSTLIAELNVPFRGQLTPVSLYKVTPFKVTSKEPAAKVNQYVIWHHSFASTNGSGVYQHDQDNRPFASDANKFALFSVAVCEFLRHKKITQPDVIHLHDWHAAMVSVLLSFDNSYQTLNAIKRVYTVHNIALQGTRPLNQDDSSLEAWFPHLAYQGHLICDPNYLHCFNPMRAGINLADKVHVVSPTYSLEVQQTSNNALGFYGGEGLENDLQSAAKAGKLVGILNGCEYPSNTESAAATLTDFIKQAQSCLLQWAAQHTHLQSSHFIATERIKQWQSQNSSKNIGPLVTSVGRLTEQKARLLVETNQGQSSRVVEKLLISLSKHQGRMILIGTGDQYIEQALTQAMAKHDNFLFLNGFDSALSEKLYPLGNLFLMPSSFEPCGISQMLAMRAGQPCLVNQVGGLKDTVINNETGFCFYGDTIEKQKQHLCQSFNQALTMFTDKPKQFNAIAELAKQCRFDWQKSIERYISNLYN